MCDHVNSPALADEVLAALARITAEETSDKPPPDDQDEVSVTAATGARPGD